MNMTGAQPLPTRRSLRINEERDLAITDCKEIATGAILAPHEGAPSPHCTNAVKPNQRLDWAAL